VQLTGDVDMLIEESVKKKRITEKSSTVQDGSLTAVAYFGFLNN
jgi:hypothetical protein